MEKSMIERQRGTFRKPTGARRKISSFPIYVLFCGKTEAKYTPKTMKFGGLDVSQVHIQILCM